MRIKITAFLLTLFFPLLTFAQAFDGIIPSPGASAAEGNASCIGKETWDLGTKIQWGCVELADIPIIIIRLIDLVTKLAGSVAVILLLYGGIQLMISGATDDRESAKNTKIGRAHV